jgi:hypothetical protein
MDCFTVCRKSICEVAISNLARSSSLGLSATNRFETILPMSSRIPTLLQFSITHTETHTSRERRNPTSLDHTHTQKRERLRTCVCVCEVCTNTSYKHVHGDNIRKWKKHNQNAVKARYRQFPGCLPDLDMALWPRNPAHKLTRSGAARPVSNYTHTHVLLVCLGVVWVSCVFRWCEGAFGSVRRRALVYMWRWCLCSVDRFNIVADGVP